MKKTWINMMLCLIILLAACNGDGTGNNANEGTSSPEPYSSEGRKRIVVSVMSADSFLLEAARKFEELHEDIQIEIKEYQATAGDGSAVLAMTQADMDKFVQTVTTEALAGKASDLIAMNNLPLDKFIDNNVLVDLNELIAKDASFDKTQYYLNILQTSNRGDSLYSIPFGFYLTNVIHADRTLLNKADLEINDDTWTWQQFKDIAQLVHNVTDSDVPTFANMPPVQLLYQYIDSHYGELVKEGKANFDTDSFRNVLHQIKSLYDDGILSMDYLMDPGQALFSLYGLSEPTSALRDLLKPESQFLQMPSFDGQPSGFAYQATLLIGINSKSEVQQEAWEFVKFMLSEEMQSSPGLGGYPLNKTALDHKLEESRQMIEQGEVPISESQPSAEALNEKIQVLKDILESMHTKSPSNLKVSSIAIEEFNAYLSGQKSAEEVSKLIQNRVDTYLNE